jgi:hypothetical protein
MSKKIDKRIYCVICGGKLRYDEEGPYCLTINFQGSLTGDGKVNKQCA